MPENLDEFPADFIKFDVEGIPSPGGSKRYMGKSRRGVPILVDMGGIRTKHWRAAVWAAGMAVRPAVLWTGPLRLDVLFRMPRPDIHYRFHKGKPPQLRPEAPTLHTLTPDTTKLLRSTEDALKEVIWRDDSQICRQYAEKVYSANPGATITITRLNP